MNKKINFILGVCTVAVIGVNIFSALPAQAANTADDIENQLKAAAESGAGYSSPQDPRVTAAVIIRSALTVVGTILICLLLYAGFLWMTAGGNEDNVAKAKSLIKNAVIGLAIILSAYSLTYLFTYLALGGKDNILEQQTDSNFNPFD